ncbi:hypothetical protein V8E51_017624 [Hyaloscypha variabilis]
MSTKTCHVSTLQQVVHESLDELAAKLRTTVNPGALRENMLVEAKSLASRSRKGERRSEVDQREVLVVSSVCLRMEDMEGLRADEEVRRFGCGSVERWRVAQRSMANDLGVLKKLLLYNK